MNTASHDVNILSCPDPAKGKGVFALREFVRGETVIVGKPVALLTERTIYSVQVDVGKHVDLNEPARVTNHSCTPNTGVLHNSYGGYDFIALRDIARGEEITWNYQTTEEAVIGFDKCHCNSPDCQAIVRGFAYLPDTWKQVYATFVADYLKR
jgi:hypothetical protein